MSYFRSYFEKNNTIIKTSDINTAKNPTTEIFYGSGFSKYIFKIDLSDLISKVQNGDYVLTSGTTHTLHLTNTIFGNETFLGAERGSGKERAVSFDLILFKISQLWDEGVGFDYEYSDYIAGDLTYDKRPSNWYNATTQSGWTIDGIYSTTPDILTTIHFDNGNEDINLDITDYVNGIISGSTNFGLGLAFSAPYETITTVADQSVAFFSKYTQTFFEPYMESYFNDEINDSRNNFVLNLPQDLYLYVYSKSNFADLDNTPTVDILDSNGDTIINDLSTIKVRKGVYKVSATITGSTCTQKTFFYDVWKDITIDGVSMPNVTQKFVLNPYNELFSIGENQKDVQKYVAQFYGIKQNEKIKRGNIRKLVVAFKSINNPTMTYLFDEVYFRMYVKEGLTNVIVHDWTLIDKTNENSYYFDTSIYIPREYYIEIKGKIHSEEIFYKNEVKFEIISEK